MKNKRKNTFTCAKWGIIAACFVVILVVSIFGVKRSSAVVEDIAPSVESTQTPQTESSNTVEVLANSKEEQVIDEELQLRIDGLAVSDCLGWIVYGNRIYIQDTSIDTVDFENNIGSIELSECLGHATDFKGFYADATLDGDLYMVANNSDILVLKLDNGGTVWLRATE